MQKCLNWDPKELGRIVGITTSGAKASIVPVRISREDIEFVRDEMLAVIDDVNEGKRYLGIFKGSTKKDLALDASALPTYFSPENSHMYSAPLMISYIEIIGEITCHGIELNFSIPRPGGYVYVIIDGKKLQKILGIETGLRVGVHKFSLMEIPLDPQALCHHIAIVGATGTGKSRLAKGIVEETLNVTDYNVIIFDHTGVDYADKRRWNTMVEVLDSSKIVLDPDVVSQIIVEEADIPERLEDYIYGAVIEYIRKNVFENIQQQNIKRNINFARFHDINVEMLLNMYRKASQNNLFVWNFDGFLQTLEEYIKNMGGHDVTVRKLKLLISTRLGRRFFEKYLNGRNIIVDTVVGELLTSGKRLVIIDMSSEIEYIAKRGVVYQFMKIIWDSIWGERTTTRKILAVVDEAHNYSCLHGCEPAKGIIARTVREGRKWGFGVILVSQRVIDLAPEIRGNINTIFFSRMQSVSDYNELKNWIEGVQFLEYTLPMLSKREFFFVGLGNILRKPVLIRVKDVS